VSLSFVGERYLYSTARVRSLLDDYQVLFDRERIAPEGAEVDTRVVDPAQHKSFAITYCLRQREGQWRIHDVVVENVSLVRNYRTQFARILSKASYEELVRTIRSKLQQPDPPPAS
jgi:phospholipid transport system substrate-binding protein